MLFLSRRIFVEVGCSLEMAIRDPRDVVLSLITPLLGCQELFHCNETVSEWEHLSCS